MAHERFMIGCYVRTSSEAPWCIAMSSAVNPPLTIEDIDPDGWLDDLNHEIRIQRIEVQTRIIHNLDRAANSLEGNPRG